MQRFFKRLAITLLAVIAIPALYVGASYVGALVPGDYKGSVAVAAEDTEPRHKVILVMGLLHADFAFPVNDSLKARLAFLSGTGFPLEHPDLRYITVGWGSKAFYTTAGTYSDIEATAVFKAVTGDAAVMRFVGAGDLSQLPDTVSLRLTQPQYEQLLNRILTDLKTNSGRPDWMQGESIGAGDAFYEAKGHFNIFNPCNQWANTVLRDVGVPLGVWTPTAQSLRLSLTTYAGGTAK